VDKGAVILDLPGFIVVILCMIHYFSHSSGKLVGLRRHRMPLLLDGLEVFHEELDMAAGDGFAERPAPHHLLQTFTPDRHVPPAMRRHPDPAVDIGTNFGDGEVSPTPLGKAREIRWGWLER
jgi:hypothetical protein